MLEAIAAGLFILWVIGLVSGMVGMGVHFLLAGAILTLFVRHRVGADSRAMNEVSPSAILAIMTRKSREEP